MSTNNKQATAEKLAQLTGEFLSFKERVLSDSADLKNSVSSLNEKLSWLINCYSRQTGTMKAVHWAGGLIVACVPTAVYAFVREVLTKK